MKAKLRIGGNEIEVKENPVDKLVRFFAPVKGEERFKSRMRTAAASGYSGASRKSRSLSDFNPISGDADSALLDDLEELRDRSRDLVRNTPIASGAISTVVSNVIGTGMKLNSRINHEVIGITPEKASEWQTKAEMEFKLWSESMECSASNTMDFAMLQDVAFRSVLESGDVLSVCVGAKSRISPYRLKVQLIEADRVSNKDNARDTSDLTAGVKKSNGQIVGYQVLNTHPNNRYYSEASWSDIPVYGASSGVRKANLLFRPLRPGQTRGVPYLAPVIEALKQLGRYTDAELMAAVISGMFTVFINSDSDSGENGFSMSGTDSSSTDDVYELGNGAVVHMGKDESVETANPGRPNAAFDPFVQAILRQVGAALELPYEVLIKHFAASYSASQGAILEAWRFFRGRREWMAKNFCQPIYENFLYEAISTGRLVAPGFLNGDPLIRKAYCGSEWIGMPRMSIDRVKDAKAHQMYNELGIMSRSEITSEVNSGNWEDKHAQIVKENNMRKRDGLENEVVTVIANRDSQNNSADPKNSGDDKSSVKSTDSPMDGDDMDSEQGD